MDATDEERRFDAELDAERQGWSKSLREGAPEIALVIAVMLIGGHLLGPDNFFELLLLALASGTIARRATARHRRP